MKKSLLKFGSLFLLSLLVFTFVFPSSTILAQEESRDEEEMVDIIVRYNDTVPDENELDPAYKNVRSLDILPIQAMTVPKSAVKIISSQKNVKRVTYNQEVVTPSETDTSRTLSEYDWNNNSVGSFDAWDEGLTGKDIKIAVIDTGFYDHGDIEYAGGFSVFDDDHPLGADPWTNDHDGHGTHVAGILGASQQSPAHGIAPDALIYGVKVYHQSLGTKTSYMDLSSGIDWAIRNNMDIINISSGFPNHDSTVSKSIDVAVDAGILVVAANGNSTSRTSPDYPAAYENVIGVSNINSNKELAFDSIPAGLEGFSAPGQAIYGLSNSGGYENRSGTSQATPHVSGVAALLMQKYPNASSSTIKAMLQSNAWDLGDPGQDKRYGYGLVQYVSEGDSQDSDDSQTDNSGNESEEPSETDKGSEEEEPASDTPDDNAENENNNEDPETEKPSEEEPDKDDESEGSSETEEPADDSDSSNDQEVDVSENAVWIRPDVNGKSAIFTNEDLESVADNGVLAVSFDYAMDDIEQLDLSKEQINEIRERNISILIARPDIEWLIPANNFQQGYGSVRFTKSLATKPAQQDLAKSDLYQFELLINDQPVQDFEEVMTYRFFSDLAEVDQDMLYLWNKEKEAWTELGDTYVNGALVGKMSQVGILGVFSPSAFDGSTKDEEKEEEKENSEEKEEITATESESDPSGSSDDQEQEVDSTQAGLSETSDIPSPLIVGAVVVLLSFGGGFYYFGGKSKS
ncbi:Subtilase family protein [Marinilactibacillus piezotolerans]|uniref:Subtilase family protein n=1 Tax=Marinilactibacillus piezotolerans TaxID=258723 RepID=A0A1I3VHC8_9LACT|nr:S8 family serine peptidase [Marinilactibacillus piezotolerans]SFJ94393.1 Subtilase family protein [Marinilactibacillus piezotolerans]